MKFFAPWVALVGAAGALGGAACHYKVMPYGSIDPAAAGTILEHVVHIRGLAPRRPIRFRAVALAAARAEVRQIYASELGSGAIGRQRRVLLRLGLLAPGDDLAETYRRLYADAPLGSYEPESGEMRLVARDILRSEVMEILAWARQRDFLLGEALAHEITHALVDQHHGLAAFERGAIGEDARLARRSVSEGDASKVGFTYGSLLFKDFETYLRWVTGRLPVVNADDPTPFALRERFQFPYLAGALFVEAVCKQGGWAAVDALYADPPRSTEQILHPAKYLRAPRDEPALLPDLPESAWAALGGGAKLVRLHDEPMGELGVGLRLGRLTGDATWGRQAALGWGGDRAIVLGRGDRTLLVWRSVWDDEAAAARVFLALARAQGLSGPARGGAQEPSGHGVPPPAVGGTGPARDDVRRRREADGWRVLRRDGRRVDEVAGLDETEAALVLGLPPPANGIPSGTDP